MIADLEAKGILPERMLADSLYGSDDNVTGAEKKGIEVISPVIGPTPAEPPKNPTAKQVRLQARREQQETDKWKQDYSPRAQLEGTIGSIKRRTGLDRLRCRGKTSVFSTILLKLASWNISRAVACLRKRRKSTQNDPTGGNCPDFIPAAFHFSRTVAITRLFPLFRAA